MCCARGSARSSRCKARPKASPGFRLSGYPLSAHALTHVRTPLCTVSRFPAPCPRPQPALNSPKVSGSTTAPCLHNPKGSGFPPTPAPALHSPDASGSPDGGHAAAPQAAWSAATARSFVHPRTVASGRPTCRGSVRPRRGIRPFWYVNCSRKGKIRIPWKISHP